ncbi:MAG: hypothetical protein LBL99_04455 [Holosporaceae bacterium]|jgi:hypothetical protein|nr:hypothetical protein [Holosporaceae bacterium]
MNSERNISEENDPTNRNANPSQNIPRIKTNVAVSEINAPKIIANNARKNINAIMVLLYHKRRFSGMKKAKTLGSVRKK